MTIFEVAFKVDEILRKGWFFLFEVGVEGFEQKFVIVFVCVCKVSAWKKGENGSLKKQPKDCLKQQPEKDLETTYWNYWFKVEFQNLLVFKVSII